MALAPDAHGVGTAVVTTPQDQTVTVAAGATQLFAAAVWEDALTVSSFTWDQGGTNQAMSSILSKQSGGGRTVHLFGLKSPTTGTKTLRCVWSADPSGGANIFWISFTGGDTTTGWRTATGRTDTNGTGPGLTDGSWVSGDYEIHAAMVDAATITFDAGETSQEDDAVAGSAFSGGLSYKSTSGAVGCTDAATYAEVAVAVMPAGSTAVAPSVNDTATVTESVTMKMHLQNTAANDTATVAEAVTMHMPIHLRMEKLS